MVQVIADEYLAFLKAKSIHVPLKAREAFIEDLKEDIRQRMVKTKPEMIAVNNRDV